MSRIIVAFTGLAGSGKTTAALRLVDRHGYTRTRFADPIKRMAREFGMTEREIEGDLKEEPCALACGKTPRFFMQRLGTEFGRQLIGEDVWVNAWRRIVDGFPEVCPVVVDDCRFPNESEIINQLHGHIVHIVRPGAGTASKHESEAHDLPRDCTIINDGSIDNFLVAIDALHADLAWAHPE